MSVGRNIRELREKKGVSQKDLSDILHVTPQAVSRWENDAVEPSIDTLRMMSSYFEVSLDTLLQKEALGPTTEEPLKPAGEVAPEENSSEAKPVVHELVGICARCGKAIYSDEKYGHGSKETRQRTGRGKHGSVTTYYYDPSISTGSALFCDSCCQLLENAKLEAIKAHHAEAAEKDHKGMGWGLFAGIAGGVILALISIYFFSHGQAPVGGWLLALSPVLGYLLFALVYVLIVDNSFVSDLFMEIVSLGFVKMPGVIFSLDFDGIAFLIIVKILFAIIGFTIALAALVAGILFAGIFACFVFPFSRKKIREEC
jgi:transcriptional regulator with XRE-family HTH domain